MCRIRRSTFHSKVAIRRVRNSVWDHLNLIPFRRNHPLQSIWHDNVKDFTELPFASNTQSSVSPAAASDSIGATYLSMPSEFVHLTWFTWVASSGSSAAWKGRTSPLTGRHSAGDCVQKAAIHHKSDAFEGKWCAANELDGGVCNGSAGLGRISEFFSRQHK